MRSYLLETALVSRSPQPIAAAAGPPEWVRGALVSVTEAGIISRIDVAGNGAAADGQVTGSAERVAGIVLPGMPNAHSHAFQRAMAGNAEFRQSATDSFWTWRQAMYVLANRVEPDQLQLIATQLFIEMLKSGYTAVAEFHYLHRRVDGTPYHDGNALWNAITAAAADAGIALTLLPTLYQTSDFGARPLKSEQRRFRMESDEFVRAVEARIRADPASRTGVAFHSLRAVPLDVLHNVAAALRSIDAHMPIHIHVAEQAREVRACQLQTGRRPIELLLDTGLPDGHWCLVHATHATAEELHGIVDCGAVVCVSISTEANLGDGHFGTAGFLGRGGRLCIGSDSQITVSPSEELRWMEYQQRLRRRRRVALATTEQPHAGTRLWQDAASAGAQALAQPVGAREVGRRADWLVLDPAHPSLAGSGTAAALDHLIFAGADAAIRGVMVGGRWVVRDGRHEAEERTAGPFAELMRVLKA